MNDGSFVATAGLVQTQNTDAINPAKSKKASAMTAVGDFII